MQNVQNSFDELFRCWPLYDETTRSPYSLAGFLLAAAEFKGPVNLPASVSGLA